MPQLIWDELKRYGKNACIPYQLSRDLFQDLDRRLASLEGQGRGLPASQERAEPRPTRRSNRARKVRQRAPQAVRDTRLDRPVVSRSTVQEPKPFPIACDKNCHGCDYCS